MAIYQLNTNEFNLLLERRYHLLPAKRKIKGEYSIETDEVLSANKSVIVLFSSITRIVIPDAARLPQLRTLYGIPAGLLSVEAQKVKKQDKSMPIDLTPDDLFFRFLRRGMLYELVWSLKHSEASRAKCIFRRLFMQEGNCPDPFLLKWVKSLLEYNKFPEEKPQQITLDQTRFDFQFIWLGKFLATTLFPDTNKMDESHRTWFMDIKKGNYADAPELFKKHQTFIIGYLIATRVYNEGKTNYENIFRYIHAYKFPNAEITEEVYGAALFFIGLFESKADLYYLAAASHILFSFVEKYAFSLAFNRSVDDQLESAFQPIEEAFVSPHANCFAYYSLKNPAIAGRTWYLWNNGEDHTPGYPEQLAIIRPDESVRFLRKTGLVFNLSDQLSKSLHVTDSNDQYQSLRRRGIHVALRERGGVISSTLVHFDMKQSVVTWTNELKRWLWRYLKIDSLTIKELLPANQKNWVLLTRNFQLDDLAAYWLSHLARKQNPENIFVFNFVGHHSYNSNGYVSEGRFRQESIPFETSGTGEGKSTQKRKGKSEPVGATMFNSASLQAQIGQAFPKSKCSIISKQDGEAPWEMIHLGIGAMREIDLKDCTIMDFRTDHSDTSVYEYVLRCFRDVIVYDSGQRYMFMNL